MIIFYNTKTGLCIRAADGNAENITIVKNSAYYEGELVLKDMTDIIYVDILEQNILQYGNTIEDLPTLKQFTKLKTGIPINVRISKLEKMLVQ